jgi:imidazolonepropionase-like amidohydrolase
MQRPQACTFRASQSRAARTAVAAARTAGYDLIKSHHIVDPAIWQAVQDEAKRAGLPTAGHVTNPVGLDRAMAAGQQVEHLDGVIYALLPEGAPERQIDFSQIPPPQVVLAASRATDAQIEALARRLVAAKAWHVPTVGLFEKIVDQSATSESLRAQANMRFVPEQSLQQWTQQRAGFLKETGYTPEAAKAFVDLRRRIVRIFHGAGVPMMAGSDTAQFFHIWGPGLIEEVEALHAAGLTPMAALRSATVVPRDYFRSLPNGGSGRGWKADFGTIEPGARADLILLRGDPSRDLKALRRLDSVVAAGKLHDRAALDAMLTAAATAAKAAAPPAPTASVTQQQPIYVMRHLNTPQGERDPRPPPGRPGRCPANPLAARHGPDRGHLRHAVQAHPADRSRGGGPLRPDADRLRPRRHARFDRPRPRRAPARAHRRPQQHRPRHRRAARRRPPRSPLPPGFRRPVASGGRRNHGEAAGAPERALLARRGEMASISVGRPPRAATSHRHFRLRPSC